MHVIKILILNRRENFFLPFPDFMNYAKFCREERKERGGGKEKKIFLLKVAT